MDGKGTAATVANSKQTLRRHCTAAVAGTVALSLLAGAAMLLMCIRMQAGPDAFVGYTTVRFSSASPSSSVSSCGLSGAVQPYPVAQDRTLVIYVYGGNDTEYPENFRFFVDQAMREGDNCDYIVVLQEGNGTAPLDPLPALPPNARYLRHPNSCFDFGTIGWVLDTQIPAAELDSYKYFMWLNPSVRGPFMPAYVRDRMHWTEPFISRLSPTVKLVGCTISCVGIGGKVPPSGPPIHVQSYVAATDRHGLDVLRGTGTVFKCWTDLRSVIERSEMGASAAIFAAGYTIDSLMLQHQGVDWRDPAVRATACNGGRNPIGGPSFNGGIPIHPTEALFIKVKDYMLEEDWPAARAAVVHSEWTRQAAARRAAEPRQGATEAGSRKVPPR